MSAGKVLFVTALDVIKKAGDPAPAKDQLGDIRYEGGKVYKYVTYSGGTAAGDVVKNDVVVYHGADGLDDNQVTGDYTDGEADPLMGTVAGIGVTAMSNQTDATKAEWGWIQGRGYATLSKAFETSNDDIWHNKCIIVCK